MSYEKDQFVGVWTAVVTPFQDSGDIDWPAYETLLERQSAAGIKGIVVAGTTGESPALSVQEKLSLIRKARASLPPHVEVMAGTGGSNTEQSVELSKLAEDAGAGSLLVVTPPYNKPSPEGLRRHFAAVANAVSIPLCLYHVPARTGQFLSPDVLGSICANPRIIGVKEASADIGFLSRAKMKCPGTVFLSGDDPTYLASLAVGAAGVISVVSNVYPALMVALQNAFTAGDLASALKIHERLLPVIDILFCESNPSPTKAALEILGLCRNKVRLPLAEVSNENHNRIRETLSNTGSDEVG